MQLLAGGCRITHSGEGETFTEGTRRFYQPISRALGARQIAQTINRYAPGRSPARINPDGEEVHFVVSGRGRCAIAGHRYTLEAGTAIYVPAGAPCCFENQEAMEMVVVSVCCPEDNGSYTVENAAGETVASDPAPRRTVHERESKAIPTGERQFKLLIDKSFGCERVTQFIGFIPPSRAPFHHHTYEEAIYILAGRGVLWTGQESGEFSPGGSIYLPAGVSHCLENPYPEPVRLLGVFYPAGSPAARYDD
jgi:mannose-6-phosphate isomerase-like protein (cupin superfamily)